MHDECIGEHNVNGHKVYVYGLISNETPDGEYDGYDAWTDGGMLLNEWETLQEYPTMDILALLWEQNGPPDL